MGRGDVFGKVKGLIQDMIGKLEKEADADAEEKALAVLQEYYGAASAGHQKSSGAGGSIIDILQTVESDFATNLAKVEAQESDSQSEYEKVTQENKVTQTSKEGDQKYKSQEVKSLGKTSAEYKGDRDTAKTELGAVNEYYGKVKDRCIAKPETYEDRKARREAEIAGLKQALTILENEAAFVQRGHRGHGFLRAQ